MARPQKTVDKFTKRVRELKKDKNGNYFAREVITGVEQKWQRITKKTYLEIIDNSEVA